MLDPDGIQIQNGNLPSEIKIIDIPIYEYDVYLLDDDKDYDHYIKDIEKEVRKSFEYRAFIKYLRENMNMDKCAFLKNVTNFETFDIKIEIHHYPFTLRDIVEIVYRKRCAYKESLELEMVAKEVMILHYRLMIGLIPLSETVHQLVHAGRLFIPVDRVAGRYSLFIDYYKPFCTPEQLETINRIEQYTIEQTSVFDTTIIDTNKVTYKMMNPEYQLPEFNKISDNMIQQIENIKNNNYMLPDNREEQKKEIICPIEFYGKEES